MKIHQVWIGEHPIPKIWIRTVTDFCSQYKYEYILWTDDKIKDFPFENRALYDKLRSESYAGAVDVLRYEILNQEGGVYLDADTVVVKPAAFHAFLQKHANDVFFGCEVDDCAYYANGILGTPAHSPFFKTLVKELPAYAEKYATEGPQIKTGPGFLTYIAKQRSDYVLIPTKVFYPISWHNISDPYLHMKITLPDESLLFQYGYSTNKFNTIFEMWRFIFFSLMGVLLSCLLYLALKYKNRRTQIGIATVIAIILAVIIRDRWIP